MLVRRSLKEFGHRDVVVVEELSDWDIILVVIQEFGNRNVIFLKELADSGIIEKEASEGGLHEFGDRDVVCLEEFCCGGSKELNDGKLEVLCHCDAILSGL